MLRCSPEHMILAIIELDLNPKKWIKLIRNKDDLVQTADLGLNLHELFSCAVNRRVGRGMTRNELDLKRLTSKLRTKIVNLSSSSTAYNYYDLESEFKKDYSTALEWYKKAIEMDTEVDKEINKIHLAAYFNYKKHTFR